MVKTYKALIQRYLRAKDHSKPHLMSQAFAESAELRIEQSLGNMDFPGSISSEREITRTLVEQFNDKFDNIYTICLADTVRMPLERRINCRWMVAMRDKSSGEVKVGFGSYKWYFNSDEQQCRIDKLKIRIDSMATLPATELDSIMSWMEPISYPWADSAEILGKMPFHPQLSDIREHLV